MSIVRTYRYQVEGTDANDNRWVIINRVTAEPGEIWRKVPEVIGGEVFMQLTGGKAVFGSPGLKCVGPYRILKVMIELVGETGELEE
jgi:hypothetical protein